MKMLEADPKMTSEEYVQRLRDEAYERSQALFAQATNLIEIVNVLDKVIAHAKDGRYRRLDQFGTGT